MKRGTWQGNITKGAASDGTAGNAMEAFSDSTLYDTRRACYTDGGGREIAEVSAHIPLRLLQQFDFKTKSTLPDYQ